MSRWHMGGSGSSKFDRPYIRSYSSGSSGIRGLGNYGLSCCVNALLQSFSATWELTHILDKWEPGDTERDSHNVPLQLKRVLRALQSDQSQPTPHADFLRCLDKNHIRLYIQHDADEVFLAILNLMHQQMDDKAVALDIQSLYKISVENHLECLECGHIQSEASYLLSLPLHIREGLNSLAINLLRAALSEDGGRMWPPVAHECCMASLFELQELRGSNICYCAQCAKKTPSKQGLRLHSMPSVLCVHLKRFRNSRGNITKLHCRVTFPETFDCLQILTEEKFSRNSVKTEGRYVLYAVIVHSGTVMFGHYTAYVRHKGDPNWHYADDSHVKQASWEEVQSSYGGGHSDTAYMLLYRRSTREEEEEQPQCSG